MFARCAALCRPVSRLNVVCASRRPLSSSTLQPRRVRHLRLGTLALTGALSSSAYLYFREPNHADFDASSRPPASKDPPLSVLLRSYIVYSMCSIPWLVDNSPRILAMFTSVPGLKQIAEVLVRSTFFAQFVGGESALDTVPVLEYLRAENKGAMLNYCAEVDESKHDANTRHTHKEIVEEIIRCIDVVGDFEDDRQAKLGNSAASIEGRKTWVAVKLTALIPDPNAFINFSKHLIHARAPPVPPVPFPGIPRPTDLDILNIDPMELPPTSPLTKEDLDSLRDLKEDLFKMCRRAKDRGVVVCIDAEHSWYQPAIEAFQLALMREFNKLEPEGDSAQLSLQPLIYGTFQAYLRRAPEHIEQSIRDAEDGKYALGVKLVRGAYHQLETSSHALQHSGPQQQISFSISPDSLPPVWQTKAETDACFNACARTLVRRAAADVRVAEEEKTTGHLWRQRNSNLERPPTIGIIFGTHNPASCQLVLTTLLEEGLATRIENKPEEGIANNDNIGEESQTSIRIEKEAARRVAVGQLYGMCDALSSSLASRTITSSSSSSLEPFVMKYIPYGPLTRVMPYLGRRAIENRSVLSGGGDDSNGSGGSAREERKRAWREIVRRVKDYFNSKGG